MTNSVAALRGWHTGAWSEQFVGVLVPKGRWRRPERLRCTAHMRHEGGTNDSTNSFSEENTLQEYSYGHMRAAQRVQRRSMLDELVGDSVTTMSALGAQ